MAFNDPFQNSLPDYFYFAHNITKGLCDFNIGQSGVVSFIYTIPTIGSKSAIESHILGGWQVGAIVTAQTGSPFTPVFGGDPYNRAQGDTNMGYVNMVSGCNPVNANWKQAGSHGLQYLNPACFTVPTASVGSGLGMHSELVRRTDASLGPGLLPKSDWRPRTKPDRGSRTFRPGLLDLQEHPSHRADHHAVPG